jgi:hypothetical protein
VRFAAAYPLPGDFTMAVIRQNNWLSQQRVDVPDLRAIESAVANDFDILAGRMFAGKQPLVIKGFTISTTGTLGNRADTLQLSVAGGLLMHFGASESGTIFQIPDSQASELLSATNTKVTGSFAANTTNYVGLDLRRSADSDTADSTKFLDANTKREITKTVPKARVLDYQIVISTQPFSAATNVAPVAKVVTDTSNNVVSITDARSLMFRLGTGSDTPNASAQYAWTDTTRKENSITFSSTSAADPFAGGDKGITSFKQWMDALMTRLWELGGGQFWYSQVARDNVKLIFGTPVLGSSNDNFDWNSGTNTLTWASLSVVFENSPVHYNNIQDGTAILNADGQCLYVDIQRDTAATLVPALGTLTSLPAPTHPGSRFILAWRQGGNIQIRDKSYEVGRSFPAATTTSLGTVKLLQTSGTPLAPKVLNLDANNSIGWTATGTNSTAITLIGNGTGAGGSFTGCLGLMSQGVFSATGTGYGIVAAGGVNNSVSGGPTPGNTPVYGPAANGGIFLGGTGTQGGDGLQAFARATGSTKSGLYAAGNNPTTSGVNGGFGAYTIGGDATAAASGGTATRGAGGVGVGGGCRGGYGGEFYGGSGTSGAIDGIGVYAEGGGTNGWGGWFVGKGTGEAIVAFGGSNSSAIEATSGAAGQSAIVGIGVSGGRAMYLSSSATNVVVAKLDGHMDMSGAGSLSTVADKVMTPQMIVRAHGRFDYAASQNISIAAGVNIYAVASGGAGGFRTVILDKDIGSNLCIQVTDYCTAGATVMRTVVDSVTVRNDSFSGFVPRTSIGLRIINASTGSGGDLGSGYGCYVTVLSYN